MRPQAQKSGAEGAERPSHSREAGFAPALLLAVVLSIAAFTLVMAAVLLVKHPSGPTLVPGAPLGQNQAAKTALYVITVLAILPGGLVLGSRLADAVARGGNGPVLRLTAAILAAALAGVLLVVRLSASLPWGDGLDVVLVGDLLWVAFAAALLRRATAARPWPALLDRATAYPLVEGLAGMLVLGLVLGFTSLRSVNLGVLAAAAGLGALVLGLSAAAGPGRLALRRPGLGVGFDLVVVVLLLLAIPNVVVFHPSPGPPNAFFVPGIIQFHQDYLLGPTNQLLGGGALMAGVPVSQYGVGFIYFLAAWFHLAPIGYGTYGFLDGLVTALFYAAGYGLLRMARTPRPLAAAALALAVVALIYHLYYAVGELPQQGPLRFGLPMLVILSAVAAQRWPARAGAARAAGLLVIGVAAVWSLEMLAYTVFTFAVLVAAEAWLRGPGERRRWLLHQAGLAVAAALCAHLILLAATLAATGRLPDWGQYLAYVDALVLGGQKAGQISYGFARWSPDLIVGAATLASAAAVVLLARRRPETGRAEPAALLALSGTTAYAIALLSYSDNRSSTYLLPYVALPTLLAATLWLALIWRASGPGRGSDFGRASDSGRTGLSALAFAFAVAAVMLGAAWPGARANFDNTALAHARPGGGLGTALARLWHPPPIDPRAPGGEALLARYAPGRRALILLPDAPDLGTEILIRSRRANRLSIGDPKADAFVDPSIWTGELTAQLRRLRPGDRLLTDRAGLAVAAALRRRPLSDPLAHPSSGENPQTSWILQRLARRFRLKPVHGDGAGLIIVALGQR